MRPLPDVCTVMYSHPSHPRPTGRPLWPPSPQITSAAVFCAPTSRHRSYSRLGFVRFDCHRYCDEADELFRETRRRTKKASTP